MDSTPNDQFAFVICQLGDKNTPERKRADEVLEHVIEPACKEQGLEVRRSDKDPTPGQITTQILRNLIDATVVVADLTGRNPNVYFELGVAQAFAKRIVLVVKDAGELPFDVKNERTIVIGDGDVLGVSEAKEALDALRQALDVVLKPDFQPTNLVTEVASARSLDALAPDNPIASEIGAIRELVEEQHTLLRVFTRGQGGTSRDGADFRALRKFVESQVEQNRPTRDEIRDLSNPETSGPFDHWVERVLDRLIAVEGAAGTAADEEPF